MQRRDDVVSHLPFLVRFQRAHLGLPAPFITDL